jgi:two-component system response regulator MtrA
MKTSESILIVDDDNQVWKTWAEALEEQGYDTSHASSMIDAMPLFEKKDFGLALVNLVSNGRVHGIEMVEWIRENNPNMAVIVVATNSTLDASIDALRKGAYDYLIKPVNVVEVVSRVDRCMSMRQEDAERLQMIKQIEMMLDQLKNQLCPETVDGQDVDQVLETSSIIVDRRKRTVVQEGEQIQLSPTEFDMLDYLATNDDRVVSASELIRAVQGYDMDEMDARPIVRVNIRRLRQKIERDTNNPSHILTVRSRGYRFAG